MIWAVSDDATQEVYSLIAGIEPIDDLGAELTAVRVESETVP